MNIGFIGFGNMGSAIGYGLVKAGYENVYAYDHNVEKIEAAKQRGVKELPNLENLKEMDVIFLSIIPDGFYELAKEICEFIDEQIIISVAAGISISDLQHQYGNNRKIVKTMPNTPAQVGEGMTAITHINLNQDDVEIVHNIMNSFGTYVEIEESMFDAFTSIAGSSPAFMYLFVEALGNAGILQGINARDAYTIVAQTMLGTSKMILSSEKHPAILRDEVCSPGGATIEGVKELENHGFRNAIIEAALAVSNKSKQMTEQ